MKKFLIPMIALALSLLPTHLSAWGTTGHRVIAEIAEENLTPEAKKEVQVLLNCQPMAYWANWADYIRSEPTGKWKRTFKCHYLDAPGHLSKSDFISYIQHDKDDNIYSEMNSLIRILKNDKTSQTEKMVALRFLIHFVGDMHQPMHTGRPEDMGGNKLDVTWFKDPTNLHAVWDSKLVDNQKYSYTEYAKILNILSAQEKAEIESGTIEDWLYESHVISDSIYDMTPDDDVLSYNYVYQTTPILERQLQRAGFRLAKILNDIFH